MQRTIKVTGLLLMGALLQSNAIADQGAASMITNTCVACHGDDGQSVGPAIPSLASMSPNYLMGAMLAYKYDDADELEAVIDGDADFEDVEAFPRYSTIMGRIAKGYSEEEIKLIGNYFSNQSIHLPTQEIDAASAAEGKKLHEKYCEKCHEDEGKYAEDDTGVLAGQWKPYFAYTMSDFANGNRAMPKKMKNKLEEMTESVGHDGIEQLADYYASISE